MFKLMLKGVVAYAANEQWLSGIWYLGGAAGSLEGREIISMIAKALKLEAFMLHERLPIGQLYVLRRGMCVKNWRFYREGGVWGDDMILDEIAPGLIDHSQAR